MAGPLSVVLAGAALVSVAMPMSKRIIRPLARKAVRKAYRLSEGVQHLGSEWRSEWQELLSEARMESDHEESINTETVITKAWRDPELKEDPETDPTY